MWNRRTFLGSTAGGLAGGALALRATAGPLPLLGPDATPDYRPVGLRWTGTGLEIIPASAAGIGDLLAFQPTRCGDRPIDLFALERAPAGHSDEGYLRPLGRHATWAEAQHAAIRRIRTLLTPPTD